MHHNYLDEFLNYLSTIQGKSENTRKEYEYDISLFLRFITIIKNNGKIEEIDDVDINYIDSSFLQSITIEDMHEYLRYCQVTRKNAAKTRARKVASIRAFFKYLTVKRKLFENNPALELETPKIGKRNPVYLDMSEIKKLYSGITDLHYYRDFCILTIFLNCGIRLSELANIDLKSIRGRELSVVGKGNKERTLYLNGACVAAIDDYVRKERVKMKNADVDPALFLSQKGNRLSEKTVQDIIKNINKRSGLNKAKLSPHKLRHTMATLLYKESGDLISLQQLLGHESVSTTQIYTHVGNETLRDLMDSNPLNSDKRKDEIDK